MTFDYPGSTLHFAEWNQCKGYICGRYVDEAGLSTEFLAKASLRTRDEARGSNKAKHPEGDGASQTYDSVARHGASQTACLLGRRAMMACLS